jgi:hypothetical protein
MEGRKGVRAGIIMKMLMGWLRIGLTRIVTL